MKQVVVKIMGGVGNQFFEYAFGLKKSRQLDAELWLDISHYREYADHTGYELAELHPGEKTYSSSQKQRFKSKGLKKLIESCRWLRKLLRRRESYFRERFPGYDVLAAESDALFFVGYWQSACYWEDMAAEVSENISRVLYRKALPKTGIYEAICAPNSIAVHIRLGDYVATPEAAAVHAVNLTQYYISAIETICGGNESQFHFFVFSDDRNPMGVLESLNLTHVTVCSGDASDPYTDMYLMSRARQLVIANSTYSWWAGFLSSGKVFAPSRWLNNQAELPPRIYPETWEVVQC